MIHLAVEMISSRMHSDGVVGESPPKAVIQHHMNAQKQRVRPAICSALA